MNNTYRKGKVFVRNLYAGLLEETDSGYSFTYDSEYLALENATPVSLTLPLSDKAYESKVLFPFFDGLIPEGWLLNIVIKNWKIDRRDRFGLLFVSAKDSIGNVSVEEVV